jgi:tetratricopeptide (TPR) repeat protein
MMAKKKDDTNDKRVTKKSRPRGRSLNDGENKADLFKKGQSLVEAHKYEEALEIFMRLVERTRRGEGFFAYFYLFSIFKELGKHDEALAICYEIRQKLHPLKRTNILFQFSLAHCFIELNRDNEALTICNKILELYPPKQKGRHIPFCEKLVSILIKLHRHQEALSLCDELLDRNPTDISALKDKITIFTEMGKYKEASDLYWQGAHGVQAYWDAFDPDEYQRKSWDCRENKSYSEAIEYLHKALEKSVFWYQPCLYCEMGKVYKLSGSQDDAIAQFNKAVDLGKESRLFLSQAYAERAIAHFYFDEYERGMEDLVTYVNLFGDGGFFYGLMMPGDSDIKRCEKEHPDRLVYFYSGRGDVYATLDEHEKAFQEYNKALNVCPQHVKTFLKRASLYEKTGSIDSAIKDYGMALQLQPDNPTTYCRRALAYAKLGSYKEAILDCSKSIELEPENSLGYYHRGFVYSKLGNDQQAIKDCDKAIDLGPENPESYYYRAIVREEIDKHEQAIKDYVIAARLEHKVSQEYLRSKGIGW